MQALVPIANAVGNGVVRQVRARRRRRIRNNQYVLGSRLMGYQFNPNTTPLGRRRANRRRTRRNRRSRGGKGTMRTAGVPIRVAMSSSTSVKPSQFIWDSETMMHVKRTNNTTTFGQGQMILNVSKEEAFPRLSQVAKQYSRYDISNVELTWKPNPGTATDGRMCMCIIPFLDTDGAQYSDVDDFTVVPGNIVTTMSQNCQSVRVPESQFNQRGVDLYVDNGGQGAVDEPLKYNFGTLCYYWDGMTAGSGSLDLGTIECMYYVTLKQPIINNHVEGVASEQAGYHDIPKMIGTGFSVNFTDPSTFTLAKRKPYLLYVTHATADTVTLSVNGVPEVAKLTMVNGVNSVDIYQFMRTDRSSVFSVDAQCYIMLHEVNLAAFAAWSGLF